MAVQRGMEILLDGLEKAMADTISMICIGYRGASWRSESRARARLWLVWTGEGAGLTLDS